MRTLVTVAAVATGIFIASHSTVAAAMDTLRAQVGELLGEGSTSEPAVDSMKRNIRRQYDRDIDDLTKLGAAYSAYKQWDECKSSLQKLKEFGETMNMRVPNTSCLNPGSH